MIIPMYSYEIVEEDSSFNGGGIRGSLTLTYPRPRTWLQAVIRSARQEQIAFATWVYCCRATPTR